MGRERWIDLGSFPGAGLVFWIRKTKKGQDAALHILNAVVYCMLLPDCIALILETHLR